MTTYFKCSNCGKKFVPTNPLQKYCHKCRPEMDRKYKHESYMRRKAAGYKPPPKLEMYGSECDTCKLRDDCMYRVKRGIDPYCWNGSETNNRYYYLYEQKQAEYANA